MSFHYLGMSFVGDRVHFAAMPGMPRKSESTELNEGALLAIPEPFRCIPCDSSVVSLAPRKGKKSSALTIVIDTLKAEAWLPELAKLVVVYPKIVLPHKMLEAVMASVPEASIRIFENAIIELGGSEFLISYTRSMSNRPIHDSGRVARELIASDNIDEAIDLLNGEYSAIVEELAIKRELILSGHVDDVMASYPFYHNEGLFWEGVPTEWRMGVL